MKPLASLVAALALSVVACGGKSAPRETVPLDNKAADDTAAPTKPVEPAPTETPPTETTAASTPADPQVQAAFNSMVAVLTQLSKVVAANPDDCDKIATGFDQVLTANQKFVDEMRARKGDTEFEKQIEQYTQAHVDEIMSPAMALGEAAQKCSTNARFAEVMKKLE